MVVIGELKLSFSLDLVLQAVDRAGACDEVGLADGAAGCGRLRDPRVRKLCRLLGFGLLGVSSHGAVEVLVEPRAALARWAPKALSQKQRRISENESPTTGASASYIAAPFA